MDKRASSGTHSLSPVSKSHAARAALLLFAAIAALSASGCLLGLRGAVALGARGAVGAGATRGALGAAMGARGLAAYGGAAGVAEIATARTAASGLFRVRSFLGTGRVQVVARGTGVVGSVELTSGNVLVVRSYGGGTALRAVRNGSRVTYEVGGNSVGYSELRGGLVHHYVNDGGAFRYIGHDVVVGTRVMQYAADGAFIVETSLESMSVASATAAHSIAALLVASADNRDAVSDVQRSLSVAGYYEGAIDGEMGYWTRRAIQEAVRDLDADAANRKAENERTVDDAARKAFELLRDRRGKRSQ